MILDLLKVNLATTNKTLASLLYFDEMQNVNANPAQVMATCIDRKKISK